MVLSYVGFVEGFIKPHSVNETFVICLLMYDLYDYFLKETISLWINGPI